MLVNASPCSKLQRLIPQSPLVHVLLMDSFVKKCFDLSTRRLVCYVRLSGHPAEPRIPLQFKLQLKDRTKYWHFFFLWFGRCRSKARSWNWYKQVKLIKNSNWNAVVSAYLYNGKSTHHKHKKNKTSKENNRRPANPPARLAFRQGKQQRSIKQTGPGPNTNKNIQDLPKDTEGISQCVTRTCNNWN